MNRKIIRDIKILGTSACFAYSTFPMSDYELNNLNYKCELTRLLKELKCPIYSKKEAFSWIANLQHSKAPGFPYVPLDLATQWHSLQYIAGPR